MRICRGLAFHILDVVSVAAAVEDGVGAAGVVLDEPIDLGALIPHEGIMRICRGLAFHILDVVSVAAAVEDGVGAAGVVLDEPIDLGAALQIRGEVDARGAHGDFGRGDEPEVPGTHSSPHVVQPHPLWRKEANYQVGFQLAGDREP